MITALLLTVPARTHSVPAATATSWAWAPGIGVQVPTEPCAPNCEIDHFSTVPTSQPWHPWAALPRSELVAGGLPCPASRVVPPLRKRRDLGQLLRSYNLTGFVRELSDPTPPGVVGVAMAFAYALGGEACDRRLRVSRLDRWLRGVGAADAALQQVVAIVSNHPQLQGHLGVKRRAGVYEVARCVCAALMATEVLREAALGHEVSVISSRSLESP